jgi:hypothetical protein
VPLGHSPKEGDKLPLNNAESPFELYWHEQTFHVEIKNVKVYDSAGKPIDAKALPKLFKKETPALWFSEKLDPLHLRTVKEGTLAFVYLDPKPAPGGARVKEAKNTPIPGLADLLKKQGYVAVPLKRLCSGHLGVHVQVRGKKLFLMLDTGASNTSFDRRQVRHLGLDWGDHAQCVLDDMEISGIKTGRFWVTAHDETETRVFPAFIANPQTTTC